MKRLLRYLFWRLVYVFRRRPRTFDAFLLWGTRCRPPWWKFKPSLFRNDAGNQWEVYLANERCHMKRGILAVELHIGCDTGQIVGFTVFDEVLKAIDEELKATTG